MRVRGPIDFRQVERAHWGDNPLRTDGDKASLHFLLSCLSNIHPSERLSSPPPPGQKLFRGKGARVRLAFRTRRKTDSRATGDGDSEKNKKFVAERNNTIGIRTRICVYTTENTPLGDIDVGRAEDRPGTSRAFKENFLFSVFFFFPIHTFVPRAGRALRGPNNKRAFVSNAYVRPPTVLRNSFESRARRIAVAIFQSCKTPLSALKYTRLSPRPNL